MKNRPKSITMAGSVLDPQMSTEDSDQNDSVHDENKEETKEGNHKAEAQQNLPSNADIEKNNEQDTNEDSKKADDSSPLVHTGRPSTKGLKSPESKRPTASSNNEPKQEPSVSDSQHNSVPPPSSGMSTRSKVMIYVCFCLSIVFILQGVIIGMLMESNDENNNTKRVATIGEDEGLTERPTPVDSPTPTFAPTFGVEEPSYLYESIASTPGAFRVVEVSLCDDCSAAIYPSSDDRLDWDASAWINEVIIDSNAIVTLNCYLHGVCGMIDLMGSIDLAPNVNGNVYALWGKESPRTNLDDHADHSSSPLKARQRPMDLITTLTLSWEDVSIFGYDDTSRFRINAQVKISQQEVVFCYGEGNVNGTTFRSGIGNYTNGYEYTAVDITGFDNRGFSDTFPKNTCEAKILNSD
ncbi:unnamed protein product [Cylindrotheca closterium]|uniref:Uncharacterized protein n=1 Tax=Cylindrotheca closterium TaxID=2856 RepID=A0AAD2FWR4_9STRA|nr:unnamed protein product [Cylindrotheca closterium]